MNLWQDSTVLSYWMFGAVETFASYRNGCNRFHFKIEDVHERVFVVSNDLRTASILTWAETPDSIS